MSRRTREPLGKHFQDYLEGYLKTEGLQRVIPEFRHASLFNTPAIYLWLITLWALSASVIYRAEGSIVGAILLLPLSFVLTILIVSIVVIARFGFQVDVHAKDVASYFGGGVLMVTLILISMGGFIIVGSWRVLGYLLVSYLVSFIVFYFAHQHGYHIYAWAETLKLTFRMLKRSIGLIILLMPLLFTLVVFAVFSQEIWQVLGGLPNRRVPVVILVVFLPVVLLGYVSLKREAAELVAAFPEFPLGRGDIESVPWINRKLSVGLISPEEVDQALRQINWRDAAKIQNELTPAIRARVKLILMLLLFFLSVATFVVFTLYFGALFSTVLDPTLIRTWINEPIQGTSLRLWSIDLPVSDATWATFKVAALLAAFLSAMSIVVSLTDATVQERYQVWLGGEIRYWYVSSIAYLSLIDKNFQVLNYVVHDRKRGTVNMNVLVPQHLSVEEVRTACETLEKRHGDYRLFIVRAFQQRDTITNYGPGVMTDSWQFLRNKSTDYTGFEVFPESDDEVRRNHFLGSALAESNSPIPDGWFGESADAITVAKAIWHDRDLRPIILHPYAVVTENILSVTVRLTKRFEGREAYPGLLRKIITFVELAMQKPSTIWIELYYRESLDSLARLEINQEFDYTVYKDEHSKKSQYGKIKEWITS